MTTPPTPEAVEAAMEYAQWDVSQPELTEKQWAILGDPLDSESDCGYASACILAAEVERLRCELGHAQDKLERIRTLCLGSGVGLRDDVWDVVK